MYQHDNINRENRIVPWWFYHTTRMASGIIEWNLMTFPDISGMIKVTRENQTWPVTDFSHWVVGHCDDGM